jgi:hypothetical protein
MSTETVTLQKRVAELGSVLVSIHGSPHVAGIQSFVKSKTGGLTMASYLSTPATDEVKIALIDEVIDIITNQKWDSLPTPPSGQASASNKPVVAVTPVASKPITPPAPKPVTPQLPPPLPPAAYVSKPSELVNQVTTPAAADPMAMMAAALLPHIMAHLPKTQAESAPIDMEAVRVMVVNQVRQELAVLFVAFAKGVE